LRHLTTARMNALFVVRFNQFRPVLELLLQTIYCKYCNHHAIYLICLSVCLFVLKNNTSKFAKFSVHVTLGRGVVLLWQQCTSGFVDDAMFSHRANGLESKTTHMFRRGGQGGGTGSTSAVFDCILLKSIYAGKLTHLANEYIADR